MSETIMQKPHNKQEKKDERHGIDLKSAYRAFIHAYAETVEKQTRKQKNVENNV